MRVEIIYNVDKVKSELDFLKNNLSFFENNKMFYYFPFKKLEKELISKQIKLDEKKFEIDKRVKLITKKWERVETAFFGYLKKIDKQNEFFNFENHYKCFLSFYGCYGYFRFPGQVYVNIGADLDFVIETIAHELIHLLVYEKVENKSYEEIEVIVDKIMIDSEFKKLFPRYKIQEI